MEIGTQVGYFFDLNTECYEYVNLFNTPKGQEVLAWAKEKHKSLRECKDSCMLYAVLYSTNIDKIVNEEENHLKDKLMS